MKVSTSNSFLKSLTIQRRVVSALLMREIITRYGRHNIGFMWLFLEPMLFTLGVTTLWTFLKLTHGDGFSIAAFAVTGYSSILLWRNCSNRVVGAIGPNLSLMHHRNVRVIDIYLSRLILEIAGATTSLIILTLVFSSIGWMNLPDDVLILAEGWVLLAWFAIALSLIIGAASERSEMVERVWHILTYLMFPLSGAAFLVDWFPTSVQKLMLLVPMVHGTEMIRHGFFGAVIRTHEDPIYLLSVNIIMTFIGLALVRETGRRLEQ